MTVVIDGTLGIDTIQANTVTSAKIVDGAIAGADLSGAQSGSAPVYGCRAWCVFDGTLTGTNAPLAGGNVTNVVRNAVGDYTVNFTTAMQDTLFSLTGSAGRTGDGNNFIGEVGTRTVSSVRFTNKAGGAAPTNTDANTVSVVVYR